MARARDPPESLYEPLRATIAQALVDRWYGLADGLTQLDEAIVQSGRRSARMERDNAAPGQFSALTMQLPIKPNGSKIELHGWLRTAEVSGFAGLWLRTSRGTKVLSMDNMSSRRLNGSNDWAEYVVTVPLSAEVDTIAFGVLLSGTGKLWADTRCRCRGADRQSFETLFRQIS